MSVPTLHVEAGFAAGASTSTYLHLDDTARGKLDSATLAPDAVFTDITPYVRSVSIRRGANRVESPILRPEAGRATLVLRNDDRRFDPTNLAGPYVSGGVSQVKPMVALRIYATHGGATYPLYRGYLDDPDLRYYEPSYSEVTWSATDAVKVLSGHDRTATAAIGAGEDSGARVGRILDSVGWSVTDRVIAVGDSPLQATTLAGDAWAELLAVADSEVGEIYVDTSGRVVFRNRHALMEETRSATSQATFGDGGGAELPYADVALDYSAATLVNHVRATRAGGVEQTAQSALSQQQYLTRTTNRSDLALQTDADALDWANWLLYQAKDPELRFSTIQIGPRQDDPAVEDLLFAQVLGREFGDRITIIRRPPGGGTPITRDVFIRGVAHDIAPGDSWTTSWTLQSASRYAFLTLDHSTLGRLDENALAY